MSSVTTPASSRRWPPVCTLAPKPENAAPLGAAILNLANWTSSASGLARRLVRASAAFCARYPGSLVVVFTLLLLGIALSEYKISIVRPIRYGGHADEVAYALMGRAIADGRGLDVDYVSFHFIPYSPQITRREDHWPPFMGFAIAPFFMVLGQEPWVGRLAGIFIGSIGLPLATAALAMAYSRRTYVALIAGAAMMLNLQIFHDSLKKLSDVPLAMLVTAFSAAILASRRRPWLHIVAGFLAAMAYYAKGCELVLLAIYPLITAMAAGWRALLRKWMWLGLATAALLLAPWFISNWRHYGHPLHSTQNYACGYVGLLDWEEGTYQPYWGKDLPQPADRWTKYADLYDRHVANCRESFTRYALLGPSASAREWEIFGQSGLDVRNWLLQIDDEDRPRRRPKTPPPSPQAKPIAQWSEPVTALCGLSAVAFAAIVIVGTPPLLGLLWLWRKYRPKPAEPPAPRDDPWLIGATLALLLIMAVQWAFIVYLWTVESRFAYVFLPTLAVLAITGASRLLELPLTWIPIQHVRRWEWIATAILALGLLVYAGTQAQALKAYHRVRAPDHSPYCEQPFYPDLGDWIQQRLPDAVFMTRNPWELLYHSAKTNKAVNVPLADAAEIFRIARYYRVTHYVHDGNRPAMWPYVNGSRPGLRAVEGAPGPVYQIEWNKLGPFAN